MVTTAPEGTSEGTSEGPSEGTPERTPERTPLAQSLGATGFASVADMRAITFAVPGDLSARTGGTIYDAKVIAALRVAGHQVVHLPLADTFPFPSANDLSDAGKRLAAVPDAHCLIIDGLALGALPVDLLSAVAAPILALVHHPLALETGLLPSAAAALRQSERAALPFAAGVVVTSTATARELSANYGVAPGAITVAEPGVDRAWLAPADRTGVHPHHILSVGSLTPRKGFDVLLAALARVSDLPWTCTIVGSTQRDPETAKRVQALAQDAGLGGRVTFAGELDEAAMACEVARASVFALATHYEGFGMVFAEALSAGLPVVGCDGGAVADVVPREAGELVAPGDTDGFAAALRAVLGDRTLHAARCRAARLAAERFNTWDQTAALVARAANAAVDGRRTRGVIP